jgi:hypothetical protein
MKKTVAFSTGIIAYIAIAILLAAYGNVNTHREFNGVIVDAFHERFITSATPLEKFKNYTFAYENGQNMSGPAVTKGGLTQAVESDKKYGLKKWLEEGGYSADEPELPASFRHFYDPTKQPGEQYLKDHLEYLENKLGGYINFNPRIDQLNWAIDHPENPWTWNNGTGFVRAALETADEGLRSQYMAKAYRCLGHTLHLIADMGCPAHVRDDSHPAPFSDYTLLEHFGSPDPYEELFEKIYADIDDLASEPVDDQLLPAFRSAGSVRNIAHRLASYTNEKFFTNQTIQGRGFAPQIHPEYTYSLPDLGDCSYHLPSWTFQQEVSGTKIKMCKDLTYFWWTIPDRGYPYIDFECVKDQASVLVPQIIEAGVNTIRLFIPKLELTITTINGNSVSGWIVHTLDSVYTTPIYYNGKVDIYRKSDDKKLGTVDAVNGQFSGNVEVGEDDGVYARITFGDITVKSPVFSGASYRAFTLSVNAWCKFSTTNKQNGQVTFSEEGYGGWPSMLEIPLTRDGNTYLASWTGLNYNGSESTGSATITFLENNTVTLEYYETLLYPIGSPIWTYSNTLVTSQGMPLYESWGTYDIFQTQGNVYDFIQTIQRTEDRPDKFFEMIPVSNPGQPGYISLYLYY